jgi:hypothetical protein
MRALAYLLSKIFAISEGRNTKSILTALFLTLPKEVSVRAALVRRIMVALRWLRQVTGAFAEEFH